MLILQSQGTTAPQWLDALVDEHLEQFREKRLQMEQSAPPQDAESFVSGKNLAAHLCDGSRQIVYRLHRVTIHQLEDLVREFRAAADAIEQWTSASHAELDTGLVRKYAEHVRRRAEQLNQELQSLSADCAEGA